MEAEASDHKVGGEQRETKEEREDALARGKATSSVIGLQSMGTRFNTLMTIQIPLQQKMKPKLRGGCMGMEKMVTISSAKFETNMVEELMMMSGSMSGVDGVGGYDDVADLMMEAATFSKAAPKKSFGAQFGGGFRMAGMKTARAPTGKSSAARVSRGSAVDETVPYEGLKVKDAKRHENECITVTIVFYYVCAGGVPSESDVVSAINDLENMYRGVENSNLGDEKFDFMKSELTVNDANQIAAKITEQPPKPTAVSGWNFFPR
ncbi:hypothetical protein TeGR_g5424 [Tetraparma gracilis]|uniref:Uncharacterized protein n=1 Tax=Tetraparma gracilis TaxID=2962635 RepID=A0ABQ6MRS2_9STRA|nr:hypothetical protein TeGR_g5424 [Tetraparma gracilis]